ncbi:MAG TPA: carbon storage regulator [Terriglobia bacterium]|nr:carbon storage regulator [Terriglobia bacterium]
MLIISRKKDQKIVVADEVEITILEVGRNRVRFGIKAPKHIHIQTRLKGTEQEPVAIGTEVPDAAGSTISGVTSFSTRT